MAVKTYSYNDKTQLTTHFNVQEMKCKCGKNHEIKVDKALFDILELAREKLNAKSCNIYSGYRCSTHDKNVGGSGSGSHVLGQAADCYFLDKNGKKISGDLVCCTIEDIGHSKGLAIRCGGSQVYQGNIHIDVRNRKWFGNEAVSFSKSISTIKAISDGKTGHTDFLTYCYNPTTYYTIAKSGLNIRNIDNKIVGCLKYGTKINVYYTVDNKAKIGVNKYVSMDYIVPEANFPLVDETQEPKNDQIEADSTPIVEEVVNNTTEEEKVASEPKIEEIIEEPTISLLARFINWLVSLFKK